MTDMQTGEPSARKPLRLWPGVAAVAVQWLLWFVFPLVFPTVAIYGALGGVACGLAVLVWWLCFSRAPWSERLGAIVLMILAIIATRRVVHASIANGMMGNMLFFYSIPALSLALVAWAVLTRHASAAVRRLSLVGATAIACAAFTLLRTGGISGEAVRHPLAVDAHS
jgi:hypothetical protein